MDTLLPAACRRRILAQLRNLAVIGAAALAAACLPGPGAEDDWMRFRAAFIQADGRVIDGGRGGISHSEGQGIAMLLAVHHDDAHTFESVWNWTRTRLQVRSDRLLAWSWSPDRGAPDLNNATDGDLLIAWALSRAARRWDNVAYVDHARQIAQDIRAGLVREDARGFVLLPGAEGFEKPGARVVNLSYWIFPALAELAALDPAPEWAALTAGGIALLQEGHFGRWGLPADWTLVGDSLAPAPEFPARFSYDAVRIPLYLIWARADTPALLKPYRDYWRYFSGARFLPAWTDLNDDSVTSYDAAPGIRAIARLTLATGNRRFVPMPPLDVESGYYSSSLLLLCKAAQRELKR
ncbi:MAG: glycosyl hydrolase family 5 [Gammaproteobacteria bacterium]|nr:glycosyl hydrolase family 5 [Gammaproteobacteria bacterium]